MVYNPGEISSRYLDTNFYAKEAKKLHLTPELSQQFKMAVQGLVGQFEKSVNAKCKGFISGLKQEAHSPNDMMKMLGDAQNELDKLGEDFSNDLKSALKETVGSEYDEAIDQFVADVKGELSQSTNLTEIVQQQPELSKKLPPNSIFELAQQQKTPPNQPPKE